MPGVYPTITLNNNSVIYEQNESNKLSWFELQLKSRRQTSSIISAIIFLISGGIFVCYNLYGQQTFFDQVRVFILNEELENIYNSYRYIQLQFFIGNFIGFIVGSFAIKEIRKVGIYCISGGCLLWSGILLTTFYTDIYSIYIGFLFGGFGNGLVLLTSIIHISEISVNLLRGWYISLLTLSTTIGIFIFGIIFDTLNEFVPDQNKITLIRLIGILVIIISVIGILFIPFKTFESPIYLIMQNQDQLASTNLMKLRYSNIETYQIRQEFLDFKEMINEIDLQNNSIFANGNTKPLFYIIFLRSLYALSVCRLLNYILLQLITTISIQYILLILIAPRILSEFLSSILIDIIGRRKLLIISTTISGLALIVIGCLLSQTISDKFVSIVYGILAIIYEFFIGIGIGTVSLTYTSESFPLRKKSFSILFVFFIEILIHILFTIFISFNTYINHIAVVIVIGIIQITFGLYFYKNLPETKCSTLLECKNKMRL